MASAFPERSRRPGSTLYRSIAIEMLVPSIFALVILAILLLTQDVLGYADYVINRGLGVGTVVWIAIYQVIPLVTQTLPFAFLVGCMMGLGRLGADRELLALEASGISSPHLIGPVMALATGITALGFALSLYGAPWSNRQLDLTLERVSREIPAAGMTAGVVQKFGKWRLEASEVSPRGDQMKAVLVWVPSIGETIFAERGELDSDPGGARVVLHNGTMVFDPRERPRVLHFEKMVTYLERTVSVVKRSETDRMKGFAMAQLADLARSEAPDSMATKARIELHRRFALPSATLVFGLLVVPLFFSRAHFSRSAGGVLGIVATLGYYGLVQLGDGLIQAGTLDIATGVWLPNALGGIVALALSLRLTSSSSFGRHSDRPATQGPKRPSVFARLSDRRAARKSKAAAPDEALVFVRPRNRALQRYVAGRFFQMLGICFGALLVAYFLVDVLERLEWFAEHGASSRDIAELYAWRLPTLASRVIPMSLLLAAGLTVSLLTAQGELIGMRACGIPAPRALAPVLVICTVVAPLYFVLNDTIVPRTTKYYHKTQSEIRGDVRAGRSSALWYRVGNFVYQADDLDSNAGTANNIRVYELGQDARPISRVDAVEARHIGGGMWRLSDPFRVSLADGDIRTVNADYFAELGKDLEARVNTRHLSIAALRREIEEIEARGMDATHFKVDYYVKWAAPLSCIVLPAIALLFAIGGAPPPSAGFTGIMSIVIAVTFILATGVSSSLGYGKGLPPMVAGWGPPGLFGLIAVYLVSRLRKH